MVRFLQVDVDLAQPEQFRPCGASVDRCSEDGAPGVRNRGEQGWHFLNAQRDVGALRLRALFDSFDRVRAGPELIAPRTGKDGVQDAAEAVDVRAAEAVALHLAQPLFDARGVDSDEGHRAEPGLDDVAPAASARARRSTLGSAHAATTRRADPASCSNRSAAAPAQGVVAPRVARARRRGVALRSWSVRSKPGRATGRPGLPAQVPLAGLLVEAGHGSQSFAGCCSH